VNITGYNVERTAEPKTLRRRFTAFRERYRVQVSATLAVLASLAFIVAQVFPAIKEFIYDIGLLQYMTLIVLLDLAVSVYLQQRPEMTKLAGNQDESMPKLIEAVVHCRSDGADLLEYAGATTLPLIRAIQRAGVPMRMLVKHPDTIAGVQRQRMITTLDTLYNSIFENYQGSFEIRCYRLPYTLRGRRLGKEILELGWLTPDIKRETAYGHNNPSVLVDLSYKRNEYLRVFFDRTFNDLWEDKGTEDGRAILNKLVTGSDAV
jgi:hypothetical protein